MKQTISRLCMVLAASLVLSVAAPRLAGDTSRRLQDDDNVQVFIESSGFEPATLNIPVGTTVTWTNHDDVAHTVFNEDKVFISEMLDTGEKYSFEFHKAGSYQYHCSIHSGMTGVINVK